MNKRDIQESIVNKLSTDFSTIGVPFIAKNLSHSDKDYDAGVENSIAYVCYAGSQALASISTNVIAQPRNLHFNIEIHSTSLYKPNGLHAASDVVEQILVGFKPLNCERLFLIKDEISKTEQGIWVHALQFQCETRLIQVSEPRNIIIPAFKELISED